MSYFRLRGLSKELGLKCPSVDRKSGKINERRIGKILKLYLEGTTISGRVGPLQLAKISLVQMIADSIRLSFFKGKLFSHIARLLAFLNSYEWDRGCGKLERFTLSVAALRLLFTESNTLKLKSRFSVVEFRYKRKRGRMTLSTLLNISTLHAATIKWLPSALSVE